MSLTNTMALGRDCLMLELAMREPVHMGLLVSACEKRHEKRLERMLVEMHTRRLFSRHTLIAHANITRSCALRYTGCMETGRLGINRRDFRIENDDGPRLSQSLPICFSSNKHDRTRFSALLKTRYNRCKNPLGHSSQCATSETLAQRNQGAAMATSDASGCRCPSHVVKVAGSNLADHKAVGPEVYAHQHGNIFWLVSPHKCSI